MDTELKAKWIEALRSGGYRQARGQLRTKDDSFCCLGVFCDLAQPGDWVADKEGYWKFQNRWQTLRDDFGSDHGLSMEVRETLMSMNDTDKKSFVEIATWIEANL